LFELTAIFFLRTSAIQASLMALSLSSVAEAQPVLAVFDCKDGANERKASVLTMPSAARTRSLRLQRYK